MKLNHEVRPDHCEGKLLVYCRIGTKNDTIVNQTLTFECNGKIKLLHYMLKSPDFFYVLTAFSNELVLPSVKNHS